MQVSVEKISNIERKITITVPADQVESIYQKKINDIVKKSNIKGFRPGKAPISFIQQRYGNEALSESYREVIQNATFDALQKHNLQPVSTPSINPKSMEPGKPLEFEVTIEVLPEVGDIKFNMNEIEKLVVDITDKDIDYVVKQLQKQQTTWRDVEREAKNGDRIVIDYEVKFGDEKDSQQAKDFPVELGGHATIPGFEDALLGLKAGDEKSIELTMPDNIADKEKAGKQAHFNITVKKVVEGQLPDIDEAFIKKFGIASGSAEDFRKQIQESLEKERDRIVKDKLKDQVFKQLLEENPIEVPQSLVEKEAQRIHDEIYPHHNKDQTHSHTKEEQDNFNDIAKKRVGVGILIGEYGKKHHLKANKEMVQKRIQEVASIYEHPKEVAAWLSSGEQLANIENQVLEDQILDQLISNTKSIEKRMSYAELKGFEI